MQVLLRRLASKLTTLRALFQDPDRRRIYLCNRFSLAPASRLVRWLYPAWWKYQAYRFTVGFGDGEVARPGFHNRYLTRAPSAAGIGDQIVTCWSETYMLARRHGLTFAHHRFDRGYHSPETDWESFLGFGSGEAQAAELLRDRSLKRVFLPPLSLTSPENHLILSRLISRVYSQDNIVFHLGTGVYLSSDIEQSEVMPAVYATKYWAARRLRPERVFFEQGFLHVAVHVRRGDLARLRDNIGDQWHRRWIDLSYYTNLLGDLMDALSTQRPQVHIFSDGTAGELADLAALPNARLHLDQDPRHSFHGMVMADVLVVSTSAFGICAGKICEGIKLAGKNFDTPDFRLFIPRTSDWVRVEPDGHLSAGSKNQVAEQLRQRTLERIWAT